MGFAWVLMGKCLGTRREVIPPKAANHLVKESAQDFSKVAVTLSTSKVKRSSHSIFLPAFDAASLFNCSHGSECEAVSHCGALRHFATKCLSICLLFLDRVHQFLPSSVLYLGDYHS